MAKPLKPETDGDNEEASMSYAQFLREKERMCGPDGFLDSARYQHSYKVRQDKKDRRGKSVSPAVGSAGGGSSKTSKSAPGPGTKTSITVVDMRDQQLGSVKNYEKRIKVIEDHMWQHKQEERELKRVEGDIIKKQRHVRHTLQEQEQAIAKKRMAEEIKLSHGLEKYTKLQQHHNHFKEEKTKQRIENNVVTDQESKAAGRKLKLTQSNLARQYQTKLGELELKQIEQMRISHDFEAQMRKKEDEQFRLKQELAELAISLNMEAQKGRQQDEEQKKERKKEVTQRIKDDQETNKKLDNKLAKSDGDTKNAENKRRKLSANLALTKSHLHLKQREEGRHKQDTDNRLRANITEQKQLNEAALHAELDLKSQQIDERVKEHDMRRVILATKAHKTKKEESTAHETHYADKFRKRHEEQTKREQEDNVKYFQKVVLKDEEKEVELYNSVRGMEYDRMKQEQVVKKLQGQYAAMRRKNAITLKQQATESLKKEEALKQNLLREVAKLEKVHAQREDSYGALLHHRQILREERNYLIGHQKQQDRQSRIVMQSQALQG